MEATALLPPSPPRTLARGRRAFREPMSDDRDLIKAVLSGQKDAYASLVRLYYGRVFGVCRSALRNDVEAEDAAQDVFVKAYQSLPSFRLESSFGTWIFRIARNYCMDLLRSRKQR